MYENLTDVLIWFAVGGGAMWLWGVVLARILENWIFWHKLQPWVKKIVPIIFAGFIGIAAESLIAVDIVQYIPESAAAVILALLNWYFSQREYGAIKDSTYAAGARFTAANGD